jgi:FKBP-type peptidyl-prolyl cis-trans isomerase
MLLPRLCVSSLALGGRLAPLGAASAARTVSAKASLSTEESKAWHALGYNIGTQLGDLKGCDEGEVDNICSGIKAALLNEPPEVPLADYVPKASTMIKERMMKKAEEDAAKGKAALEEAAKEKGATQTASGLVVLTETEGDGASPVASDTVEVHYEGKLVDGTTFDSSYARGQPISFPLSGVIKGWTEGLQARATTNHFLVTCPYTRARAHIALFALFRLSFCPFTCPPAAPCPAAHPPCRVFVSDCRV